MMEQAIMYNTAFQFVFVQFTIFTHEGEIDEMYHHKNRLPVFQSSNYNVTLNVAFVLFNQAQPSRTSA